MNVIKTLSNSLISAVIPLVILVLGGFLVLNVFTFAAMAFGDIGSSKPEKEYLLRVVEDYNYKYLNMQLNYFTADEIAKSKTLTECNNISTYYKKAVLCRAYLDTDPTKAAEIKAEMEALIPNMGLLDYNARVINKTLHLPPPDMA